MVHGVAAVWVPVRDMDRAVAFSRDVLGLQVNEPEGGLDDAVEELRGQGVEFSGGISDHDWGRIAPFKDSEGNDLQLFEAPSR